jgi:hypothetical protein
MGHGMSMRELDMDRKRCEPSPAQSVQLRPRRPTGERFRLRGGATMVILDWDCSCCALA